MEHKQAKAIAEQWIARLSPACARIEIAGSLRRGKREPRDIELVCIPKIQVERDLFGGDGTQINLLEALLPRLFTERAYLGMTKRGPRYKQLALPEGIKLDLFIVLPPSEWGVRFLIRTGPAEFSHWAVTNKRAGGALPSYLHVKDGAVWHRSRKIETPEEEDFFSVLGMQYVEPNKRQTQWSGGTG
jgi:DNA polymerase/3'-5' exonuclease PolX